MNTKSQVIAVLAALFLLSTGPMVLADSPKDITTPDRHSVEVKGKINLYRVQVLVMNLGECQDKANAELFVTLDSKPDMVYTLELKSNSPASNKVMADTLRDAYVNKLPVTLYHQMGIKKENNFKIMMIQLN